MKSNVNVPVKKQNAIYYNATGIKCQDIPISSLHNIIVGVKKARNAQRKSKVIIPYVM